MIFKRIKDLLRENRAAAEANQASLEAADREHEIALQRDRTAEIQAVTLSGMDRRNHYSESLTYAFRGRPQS
jgi:hypothetical protein